MGEVDEAGGVERRVGRMWREGEWQTTCYKAVEGSVYSSVTKSSAQLCSRHKVFLPCRCVDLARQRQRQSRPRIALCAPGALLLLQHVKRQKACSLSKANGEDTCAALSVLVET